MNPINPNKKKRQWLILSHAFNVDGRAESQTITDKIPHLIEAGITPIVFSSVMGHQDNRFTHIQFYPWGPAGFRFDVRHRLARRWGRGFIYRIIIFLLSILLAPFIILERLFIGLRSQWSWAIPAFFHGLWWIYRHDIELVYSTGGAPSAHLAGYWLKRVTKCRWIAEVHDPFILAGSKNTTRHERFSVTLEGYISHYADLAWWFTDQALASALQRHPDLKKRGHVILPGAEPPIISATYKPGSCCVLGHFGMLSSTRSIAPFLSVLAQLLTRRPEWRSYIRLEIYGSRLDPEAQKLLPSLHLEGVVQVVGRLEYDPKTKLSGRAQVMQRMQTVDALVLLHGKTDYCREYIPSKLYEYFWAHRPIVALTHDNPQLDKLIEEHGGWIAHSTKLQQVETMLETVIEQWKTTGLPNIHTPPVTVQQAVQAILEAI